MVRDARGETGPPARSGARATYDSVLSVVLILSASDSAVVPAAPIWLMRRLQARRGGSGMLVAIQDRRHRAGCARLTRATSASRCS
jgi:hypothetical protein